MQKRYNSLTQIQLYNLNLTFSYWISFSSILCWYVYLPTLLFVYFQMTGRKGRVVSTDDGIQYKSRSEVDAQLEILNLTEKQRFMDGEKVQELWSISAF